MTIHFPDPPPHASFAAFSNHVFGGAACFPPIPRRRPSLALYCQLSDHQTAPQLSVPSRPITINRSLLSVSATCSEAELWAAACLRVRTFYDFDEQTFGIERRNAAGRLGLSTLQKIIDAFRILAYAMPADAVDEYINIGESTALEYVKRFCRAIVKIFSDQYLRSPTASDVARLLYISKERGFSGMLGSLDCMHWRWKNCSTAWAGQYADRSGNPTIILEIVADYDL